MLYVSWTYDPCAEIASPNLAKPPPAAALATYQSATSAAPLAMPAIHPRIGAPHAATSQRGARKIARSDRKPTATPMAADAMTSATVLPFAALAARHRSSAHSVLSAAS